MFNLYIVIFWNCGSIFANVKYKLQIVVHYLGQSQTK